MNTRSLKQILKGVLLVCLVVLAGCAEKIDPKNDHKQSNANLRNRTTCAPFMVPDAEIQAFYDQNPSVPRPDDTHLKALLHYNINVSDFAASKKFYKLLGFTAFVDLNINVTKPEEAQGLDLPPYSLKTTPLRGKDGFIIDLIKFNTPYDGAAPHSEYNGIGFTSLHFKSSNLKKDRAYLARNGVTSTLVAGTEENPERIQFADPDGTTIWLSQVGPVSHVYLFQLTKIEGLYSTNINVSNLAESVAFYTEVGFKVISQNENFATISLSDKRHITLTQSCSANKAYDKVNHLGIARIAITTSDLNADMDILKAKGIKFFAPEPIQGTGVFSIIRYAAFEDPDGNVLELVKLPL